MDLTKASTSLLVVLLATGSGAAVAHFAGASGALLFGVPLLLLCASVAFLIQWLAYVPAFLRRTEKFYDLVGALSYLTVVLTALGARAARGSLDVRSCVLSLLVAIWAIRLGTFLFRRVHRVGKDARFELIKQSWHRFLVAWTLQGLWVQLTTLSALVMIAAPTAAPLDAFDALGLLLWLVGFGVEALADRQKAIFSSDPANRARFVQSGLWAWSRHPNYAGEILLWTGIFVAGLGKYRGAEWLAVLSPLFVWGLLRFVSGVPILEQRADARWGGEADYEAYKAKTPLLWLWPPRRDA